jgi:uncharacterized caspase-like protein
MARKSALCIGINDYPGTGMDLNGCVNDANDWAAELDERGFEVRLLLDAAATRAAMVEAIGAQISGADKGDSVVITYSGHGTYAPDDGDDEDDGLDEGLCPYDIKQGKVLLDDDIHQLFEKRKPGVRVLLISDSCHSGTVIRAVPNDPDADGPRPRFMPMGAWMPEGRLPKSPNGKPAARAAVATAKSPWVGALAGDDLLMSGCAEGPNNFSYDARIAGRPNGAFTYYALKALKRLNAGSTYADWHALVRKSLPSASYPQTPQLFGSKSARGYKVFA